MEWFDIAVKVHEVAPASVRDVPLLAWGVLATVMPLVATIGLLQSRRMREFYRDIGKVIGGGIDGLRRATQSPIKRPRVQRAVRQLMVGVAYFHAAELFLFFVLIIFLWLSRGSHLSVVQHLKVAGYILTCPIMCAALVAEADRERMKLRRN